MLVKVLKPLVECISDSHSFTCPSRADLHGMILKLHHNQRAVMAMGLATILGNHREAQMPQTKADSSHGFSTEVC